MIKIIQTNSKKTRTFGWVQDSGNLKSLCDVVSIFDETSDFHKTLKQKTIPRLVKNDNIKSEMIEALGNLPIAIKYKLLVGTHATPRECSPCDGIIQAAVKGQKRDYIGDWPADNFLRWAQALGFVSYDYEKDAFSITSEGKSLVAAKSKEDVLENALLSYPPAFRILSLLKNPADILTKFELGLKLGFTGEDGFISYPLSSVVAALADCSDTKERAKIRSDWESSSDKYARTIAQWLCALKLLDNAQKDVSLQYGNRIVSGALGGYKITPKGERALRNAGGKSRHAKIAKRVSYEMFATKGGDREYRRLRRALVLKCLCDSSKKCSFVDICDFLRQYDIDENADTIKDDVAGFENLGLALEVENDAVRLLDRICDFQIPIYKDLAKKSSQSAEKDEIRAKLKYISHEYLSLLDLAFDSKQSRLFEMKAMELFLNEGDFYGTHLGGASKPDGVLWTGDEANFGIIVDMKAYSKCYDLPIHQRDEMLRYIRENAKRNVAANPNEWWKVFPKNLSAFYFMFVSGFFKGNVAEKLENIAISGRVNGTAMAIGTALVVVDKIKGREISLQKFREGFKNTEYRI